MVTKIEKTSGYKNTGAHLAGTVKESASQIWLAGLGAFGKAQEEGGRVFDALVKEGLSIQRKTQTVAEDKLSEASSKMASMATDISSRASGQWDKLENIFEERVSKAMQKLGVPQTKDVDALSERVAELGRMVSRMAAATTAKTTARPAASTRARAKPEVKPATKRAAR